MTEIFEDHDESEIFFPRLPQYARNFIDQKIAERKEISASHKNPELRAAAMEIESLLEQIAAPKYTIDLFRIVHEREFGYGSITCLHVSDELVFDLINKNIYFVDELFDKLDRKIFTENDIKSGRDRNISQEMRSLQEALAIREEILKKSPTERANPRWGGEF